MCGIIGIVGKNGENVVSKILSSLQNLEYRGYDSAGIAVVSKNKDENDNQIIGKIQRVRAAGKLSNLIEKLQNNKLQGTVGIGHTRWATHGEPTEKNAHPMMSKDVALVHNGIIENYKELKFNLESEGYIFESETDTEVIAHLLQRELSKGYSPRESIRNITKMLEGSYAIAVIFSALPNTIIAVRHNSSLVVGLGKNFCIGSDADSLSHLCNEIVFLENDDSVEINENGIIFFDKNFNEVQRKYIKIEKTEAVSKDGYPHFMLKEIMDQPTSIRNTIMRNAIDSSIFDGISRILIVACGTSFYAGMVAKYWFETFLKIPTDVEIASEFRYRDPIIVDNTLMISISQSGETIDTLSALEYVRSNSSCKTIAIVNVKNSAISRISDIVFYTRAGTEMCVASTKAFTAQLTVLASLAFCKNEFMTQKLHSIPTFCDYILNASEDMKHIAEKIYKNSSAIYLGRGILYPIALEGALKLKEISYIHAEGFAAGEMKHGPIALIDEKVPVIVLCPKNKLFEKTFSNIRESMARGKNIIVITDSEEIAEYNNITTVMVPSIPSALTPIVYSIPLQLLAYHTAVLKGTDVDHPRNLAKSVTVE